MRSQTAMAPLIPILVLTLAYTGCATTSSPQEEVLVTTQPAAAVTTTVTVPAELVTIHPALVTAFTGTDPEAFRVYFIDEATVVTPTRTFTGWEDIRTGWISTVIPGATNYIVVPATFVREGTDIIVESGNFSYRLTRDGTPADISGLYTHRWMKQPDGSWRLVMVNVK